MRRPSPLVLHPERKPALSRLRWARISAAASLNNYPTRSCSLCGRRDPDSDIADTAFDASHHRLSAYPPRAWGIPGPTRALLQSSIVARASADARSLENRHRARRVDALRQPQRAAVCKQERTGPGVSDRTRRENCRATRCQADAGMGGQCDPVSPRRLRPRARRHRPQGYAARGRCAGFASLSSQRRRARGAGRSVPPRLRSCSRTISLLRWPIARSRQPPLHR